jgi:Tol biopolymer transport system component
MVDVEERLRGLKERPAPDLWPEIERRSSGGRPLFSWARFAVAAAALAVAAAGVGLAVRAFVSREGNRPSAAPGGKIAYVISGEYNPGPRIEERIYIMNRDGSSKNKLVDGWTPAWSPDGSRIAYMSGTHEALESHLSVIDADGTGARILLSFSPREPAGNPAWSPDGRWIAYQTSEGIFVIGLYGGAARQVTQPPTETPQGPARCWDGEPSWSPDGQSIVFTVDCALMPSRAGRHLGLWTVRLDGSHRRQLLETDPKDARMGYENPEWSPDGQHIAFVVHEETGYDPRIAVMEADGSNVRRFALGITPAWSPDGRLIAFTSLDENDIFNGPIAVMTLDGTIIRTLTPEPTLAGEGKQYCCPAWQPVR